MFKKIGLMIIIVFLFSVGILYADNDLWSFKNTKEYIFFLKKSDDANFLIYHHLDNQKNMNKKEKKKVDSKIKKVLKSSENDKAIKKLQKLLNKYVKTDIPLITNIDMIYPQGHRGGRHNTVVYEITFDYFDIGNKDQNIVLNSKVKSMPSLPPHIEKVKFKNLKIDKSKYENGGFVFHPTGIFSKNKHVLLRNRVNTSISRTITITIKLKDYKGNESNDLTFEVIIY